jgi:hypothetical protein
MSIYTLYIKTHKKTGLKYFGQTKNDPYKYKGSGDDWLKHLAKHKNLVTTEIVLQTNSVEERNHWGRYYSSLWNIVEAMDDYGNKIWANKIPETGSGAGRAKGSPGNPGAKNGMFGRTHTTETRAILRAKKIGSKGFPGKLNPRYGKPGTFTGKKHTAATKKKMQKPKSIPMPKVSCIDCHTILPVNTITRHNRLYHE